MLNRGHQVSAFDKKDKLVRALTGLSVVILFSCIVIVIVFAFIVYRIAVREALFLVGGTVTENAASITSATAAILNLVVIMGLNYLYGFVAKKLTDWENHMYQSDYDRYLAFKVFVFQVLFCPPLVRTHHDIVFQLLHFVLLREKTKSMCAPVTFPS